MTDEEGVGSVADEATKLFDALQDWAGRGGLGGSGGLGGLGAQLGEQLGEQLRSVNEHIATGSEECAYCPVCQVIHKVREASPELRTHLAVAASSLLQAAATIVETRATKDPRAKGSSPRQPGVTRIDLDDLEGTDPSTD